MSHRHAAAILLLTSLLSAAPQIAAAASLAGEVGDSRFHPYLPSNPKDPCTKAFNAYVAASGHSAYASTPNIRVTNAYIICGARLNAPTQKAAEDYALKSCQATRSHYKVTTGGSCEIAASK